VRLPSLAGAAFAVHAFAVECGGLFYGASPGSAPALQVLAAGEGVP
jgi:hypothetical protein